MPRGLLFKTLRPAMGPTQPSVYFGILLGGKAAGA
jgi:hypothetical protein